MKLYLKFLILGVFTANLLTSKYLCHIIGRRNTKLYFHAKFFRLFLRYRISDQIEIPTLNITHSHLLKCG